ncbi:hypothetical protein SOQ14_03650 [Erythrobacter sp. T5W1-R]|uniref:hypothetical protein n=1 Tax=Erythrobacter sp. T5W1-R TaxID=3101752 RepID=UPI002AFEFE3C|nr:hypothetical protein [Erythrobacter sp. T5W1-R]MEA1618004.1 hypothetical protein [Erythrobacter sp. T5W1-R]
MKTTNRYSAAHPSLVMSGVTLRSYKLLGSFNGFSASSRISGNDPIPANVERI